jgi:hypothetical protein
MPNKLNQLDALGGTRPTLVLEQDAYTDPGFQPGIGKTMKARPIAIEEILPDPAQPRRAVPSAARAMWDGQSNADSISAMLSEWVRLAEIEMAQVLEIYIAADPPEGYALPEVEEAVAPITFKLMKLVNLANDIFLNGLNDPISINSVEGGYRTEYGERRWLAHWWLFIATGDSKWTKINAFVRDEFSVWRQASENGAREQLNAIGLARQLARLLMDIYKGDVQFQSFSEMVQASGCDRAYYAQVADGDQFRVPRGWGEKIVAAMGLSNTQMLRQYRALLRLPDAIWIQGDDLNWTENALRPHTVSVDTVSGSGKSKGKGKARELTETEKQFSQEVHTALVSLRQNDVVREDVISRIEAFCKHLRETGRVKSIESRR